MPFPVDEKYIASCEAKLGVKFPNGFREGLKKENGGEIETPDDLWILYPVFDTSDRKRIKRTANHIVAETESARKWTSFHPDRIAIGSNECGDLLVLIPEEGTNKLKDVVYGWSHETGTEKIVSPTTEILMNSRC